mmetsp:Transcript_47862/g.96589  ORF Transcript_47862/g.96589 Transcript_47862/m.96589 type:complete len:340 (+) Transcript_47862:71-1090(+)
MQGQGHAPVAAGPVGPTPRRFGPLRGGYDPNPAAILGSCTLVFCALLVLFVSPLAPNEYGLARNYLLGTVDEDVQRGGLHVLGPVKSFVTFPATQVTLEFSKRSPGSPPIATRTGADPEDPDSGGQPISISCALQFELRRDALRDVYLSWGGYASARERFVLLARNAVSNTAQDFVPQDFWKRRAAVAERMLGELRSTLRAAGAAVVRFEITRVEFAASYEASITAVQVAEQQRVVNEYDQQVQQVVQAIEVLRANNEARIANISAGAGADARELCAVAARDAFALKQGAKARKYSELKSALALGHEQMQEYFLIKSVQEQSAHGRVVVAVEGVEENPL